MTAKKIDTGTDHLLADIEDGVLTITLNRPEARNAMSRELVVALVDQLKDAQEEKENNKASGKQKLKDLGLDDDEINALLGV